MVYDIHYMVLDQSKDWTDVLLSGCAILVALVALVVSWWQAHTTQSHNRLTVRPQLEGHSQWQDGTYTLEIRNDGLGPAVITAARVYFFDSLVDQEGTRAIDEAFVEVPCCELLQTEFFYTPFVLPAGQSITVCKVKYDPEILDIEAYLGEILHLQMDYESAYKEKCPTYESRRPPVSPLG